MYVKMLHHYKNAGLALNDIRLFAKTQLAFTVLEVDGAFHSTQGPGMQNAIPCVVQWGNRHNIHFSSRNWGAQPQRVK